MALLTRRQLLGGVGMAGCARALADQHGLKYVPGQMLLKLSHPDQMGHVERLFSRSATLQPILREQLKRPSAAQGQRVWRVSLEGDFSTRRAMADERVWFEVMKRSLATLGVTAYRNNAFTVPLEPLSELNDPLLLRQYWIQSLGIDKLWAQGIVGTRQVPLVVMDTGIQLDHPDLFNNISLPEARGFYGIGLEDRDGHGTHMAGIGAAVANNGIGGSGVAPGARIVPLKALELVEFLGALAVQGTQESILAAVYHLLNNYDQAVVIMAFGMYEQMPLVAHALRLGEGQFLAVAAVGNEASPRSSRFPAAYSHTHRNVVSVTATDVAGNIASFANHARAFTDIGVYGVDMVSTYLKSGYAIGDGTSPASALIGGLAVLVWSQAKVLGYELSPAFLKRCIIASGEVDPRHVQFNPIPVLFDATRVWNRGISPDLPARSRHAQVP